MSGTGADDKTLAAGLAAGEPGAVTEFLDRSHHAVFGLACRLTTDRDLRRAWTHDVLLGLLADLKRGAFTWRRPGSFWAWFQKRAYYRLLDAYRRDRARRVREGADQDSLSEADWRRVSGGVDLETEMERVRIRAAIEECLARIPNPKQQQALSLCLLDDESYQGIAEVMGTPLNTIRAWIRRGRLALRRCLIARLGLTAGGEVLD